MTCIAETSLDFVKYLEVRIRNTISDIATLFNTVTNGISINVQD